VTLELPLHIYIGKKNPKKVALSKNIFVGINWHKYNMIKKTYIQRCIFPKLYRYRKTPFGYNKYVKDVMSFHYEPIKKYKIYYKFYLKSKRIKDPSNFWSKISEFLLDALVDYKFIIDDNMNCDMGHFMKETIIDKSIDFDYVCVCIEEVE